MTVGGLPLGSDAQPFATMTTLVFPAVLLDP